jgi:hypothetical protein
MQLPPGTIIDKDAYPVLVMRDHVGVFVLADKFRHYCADVKQAREVARALGKK